MANVAHSTLTGADLHENKGAAGATTNTVATSVAGATVWAKLTASNLTGTGNAFGAQLLHVRHEDVAGTHSQSFTGGVWNTSVLNTSKTNEITSATLSTNQLSLPSGTYFIDAIQQFNAGVTFAQLRLRNITDSTTLVVGMLNHFESGPSSATTGDLSIRGRFPLSGTKIIELQAYVDSTSAINPPTLAENVVYTDLLIWKVA